eukprot:1650017-Amphidinium_carterae.2
MLPLALLGRQGCSDHESGTKASGKRTCWILREKATKSTEFLKFVLTVCALAAKACKQRLGHHECQGEWPIATATKCAATLPSWARAKALPTTATCLARDSSA